MPLRSDPGRLPRRNHCFGLGWSGEQVALMVAFIEAVTAWVARRQVTPTTKPALAEGQSVRLPDGSAATVVRA